MPMGSTHLVSAVWHSILRGSLMFSYVDLKERTPEQHSLFKILTSLMTRSPVSTPNSRRSGPISATLQSCQSG